jgi:preprotein translocase subunit SecF
VRSAFVGQGFSDKDISVTVSGSGADAQALVRFPDTNDADKENEIRANVEKEIQNTYASATVASSERVGAVAGRELVWSAFSSVLIACALMLVYIWFRFELHFGVTAVAALVIDVSVMISMVTILRLQINSSFIAAVLTIVGYAINDTIVIFDRIRENNRIISRKEMTRAELADKSVKETLPRTINTTVTTLFTIVTLYVLGVASIKEFALPIIIGLLAGNYTSIFIAPSLWGLWQDKTDAAKSAAKQGKAKAKKA